MQMRDVTRFKLELSNGSIYRFRTNDARKALAWCLEKGRELLCDDDKNVEAAAYVLQISSLGPFTLTERNFLNVINVLSQLAGESADNNFVVVRMHMSVIAASSEIDMLERSPTSTSRAGEFCTFAQEGEACASDRSQGDSYGYGGNQGNAYTPRGTQCIFPARFLITRERNVGYQDGLIDWS